MLHMRKVLDMSVDIKKERGHRLKAAREAAGYSTAAEFARTIDGVDEYTYRTYESGSRTVSYDLVSKFANKLGINTEWVLTGKADYNGILSASVRGRIIDGGTITATHPLTGETPMQTVAEQESDIHQASRESVSSPVFALIVDTNHFEPFTKRGSVVYYSRTPQMPEECVGSPCIIRITGGSTVFAVLQRGSQAGLFDIQGHGQNLAIDWCAKREFTKHA